MSLGDHSPWVKTRRREPVMLTVARSEGVPHDGRDGRDGTAAGTYARRSPAHGQVLDRAGDGAAHTAGPPVPGDRNRGRDWGGGAGPGGPGQPGAPGAARGLVVQDARRQPRTGPRA